MANSGRSRTLSGKGETLYVILGVPKHSNTEEIKRAYRRLALKHHPDKNPDDPTAAERMGQINNAHAVLTDQRKREIYDEYGSMGIMIAERFGEDSVDWYFRLTSPWMKAAVLFCCFVTGGCCCCCCCFCCNYCCGKYKPPAPVDDETSPPAEMFDRPGLYHGVDEVITAQPLQSETGN